MKVSGKMLPLTIAAAALVNANEAFSSLRSQ